MARFLLSYENTCGGRHWSRTVASCLESRGHVVHYRDKDFHASEDWARRFDQWLRECDVVVAIITDGYENSKFCQDEWRAGYHSDKLRLILARDGRPSGFLGGLPYREVSDPLDCHGLESFLTSEKALDPDISMLVSGLERFQARGWITTEELTDVIKWLTKGRCSTPDLQSLKDAWAATSANRAEIAEMAYLGQSRCNLNVFEATDAVSARRHQILAAIALGFDLEQEIDTTRFVFIPPGQCAESGAPVDGFYAAEKPVSPSLWASVMKSPPGSQIENGSQPIQSVEMARRFLAQFHEIHNAPARLLTIREWRQTMLGGRVGSWSSHAHPYALEGWRDWMLCVDPDGHPYLCGWWGPEMKLRTHEAEDSGDLGSEVHFRIAIESPHIDSKRNP